MSVNTTVLEVSQFENVNELVDFCLHQPETATISCAIVGMIVPSRKAVAWTNHVAQMARRYMLSKQLPADFFSLGEVLLAALMLDEYHTKKNPLAHIALMEGVL